VERRNIDDGAIRAGSTNNTNNTGQRLLHAQCRLRTNKHLYTFNTVVIMIIIMLIVILLIEYSNWRRRLAGLLGPPG